METFWTMIKGWDISIPLLTSFDFIVDSDNEKSHVRVQEERHQKDNYCLEALKTCANIQELHQVAVPENTAGYRWPIRALETWQEEHWEMVSCDPLMS